VMALGNGKESILRFNHPGPAKTRWASRDALDIEKRSEAKHRIGGRGNDV